jgi:hypothetical protein
MSWNTHGISDIFITWRFRLLFAGFLGSIFIIILLKLFCNVGHFINAMTIRYVDQNMIEWNMGGNFNFIEQ